MLIIVSWLIGVGYVVFGGALLGRYLGSRAPRSRSLDRPLIPAAPLAAAFGLRLFSDSGLGHRAGHGIQTPFARTG